ncbi:hypothetical protein FXO37_20015 [Capsicum annuum]|nr:hypothetical protein FXO37_20015 [Capsicum annuum]
MDPEDVDKFDFDPLDVTKTWPEDILPLMPVGRLVLNRNIDNFFAENEQLAFNPGHIVPGIYYSEDKLLQTRIFAYADTQRHLIGLNYMQLLVNAPKCAHQNNHRDGAMNFMHRDVERTTSSRQGRDTDPGHLTGKTDISTNGLSLYPIPESLMRYAVYGYRTCLRIESLTLQAAIKRGVQTDEVTYAYIGTTGSRFTPLIILVKTGEGLFDIVSLSGSFLPSDIAGPQGRLSVSLAGCDG